MSQPLGPMFDLQNEIAVVIGGTGTLGGAIAQALGTAGAKVAILGRDAARGATRVSAIREAGGEALFLAADATSRSELRQARSSVRSEWGEPTILVNAVGGNEPGAMVSDQQPFEAISTESWASNFDLNLVGAVLLPCQEYGPGMIEMGKGSIINIASVASHVPLSRAVAYSAAKAAVSSLTQFLAREWATKGVRVNSITPGFFPARQNMRLLFNEDGSPTPRTQSVIAHTPMGRLGEPHEIAGAALFLASHDASSFVTGSDIRVDGGFLCQTI